MIYGPTAIKQGDRFQITVFDEDGAYWRYSIGVVTNDKNHLEMRDWKSGELLAVSKNPKENGQVLFRDFDILKKDILRAVRDESYKAEWN